MHGHPSPVVPARSVSAPLSLGLTDDNEPDFAWSVDADQIEFRLLLASQMSSPAHRLWPARAHQKLDQ